MFSKNNNTRIVARVTVAVLTSLYIAEWCVYNFVCEPEWFGAICFNLSWILALVSYLRCACTDPGTPDSPEWKNWSLRLADASAMQTNDKEKKSKRGWAPGEISRCDNCQINRPERAHHCNQCGQCILRMDHHCPWVGNCIGWRNHKFFILFCWWSAVACFFWLTTLNSPNAVEALQYWLDMKDYWVPIAFVIITILLLLTTAGMAAFSITMAMKNVTSIEELFSGENPYCYPSFKHNIEQLLGPIDYRLLLPTFPAGRLNGSGNSGSSFPVVAGGVLSSTKARGAADAKVPTTCKPTCSGPLTATTAPSYGAAKESV